MVSAISWFAVFSLDGVDALFEQIDLLYGLLVLELLYLLHFVT